MTFLLAQLSDPHIGAHWNGIDPAAMFANALAQVQQLRPQPDALLISGDLADHGADSEYEQLRELLEPVGQPVHVLAGNHDDRAALRRHFGLHGEDPQPIQYGIDLGPVRLVALDTVRAGVDSGELDQSRLDWLDNELNEHPNAPTILAMHHPPIWTGIPAMDEIGIDAGQRAALSEIVARHPQILRLLSGHLHRSITAEFGARPLVVAPSTYLQGKLDFEMSEFELTREPPGFALHSFVDGDLLSHIQPVS